jgi:putative ABC transport system permease protein
VVALAVIISLVFSTIVLAIGVQRSADLESERLGADIVVLPPIVERVQSFGPAYDTLNTAPTSNKYIGLSVERAIANITGISRLSPQLYLGLLNDSATRLVAFDPQTDFSVLPWLDQRPSKFRDHDAFAGSNTGLSLGQMVRVNDLTLNVVGVLDKTNSSMDSTVFFPLQTAYRLVEDARQSNFPYRAGQISVILVKLKPSYPPEILARDIGLRIPDFKVAVALGVERQTSLEIGGVPIYQLLVESVVGAALVILIAFLFSMTVNERRRQLGLLRSLGATKGFIFWLVLLEACLVALVGSLLGLGAGSAIVYFGEESLVHVFKISYLQPSLLEVVQLMGPSLLLGVGMGAAAAFYPALIASRLDPYEAIRRGE